MYVCNATSAKITVPVQIERTKKLVQSPSEKIKFTGEKELPQYFPCKLEQFYIRDCYPDYYNYVVESIQEGKRHIVVTGTLGIGKSVFYLYFFEKYKEGCDKKIVVAHDAFAISLCEGFEEGALSVSLLV